MKVSIKNVRNVVEKVIAAYALLKDVEFVALWQAVKAKDFRNFILALSPELRKILAVQLAVILREQGLVQYIIPASAGVGEEVARFAASMKFRLDQNNNKDGNDGTPGWKESNPTWLSMMADDKAIALNDAVQTGKPAEEVVKKAADLANFAMMVADRVTARDIEARVAAHNETYGLIKNIAGGVINTL